MCQALCLELQRPTAYEAQSLPSGSSQSGGDGGHQPRGGVGTSGIFLDLPLKCFSPSFLVSSCLPLTFPALLSSGLPFTQELQ